MPRSKSIGDALVLTMMRFADELADLGDFRFPKTGDIRAAELKMAKQLVESLSAKWEPEKYTDEYRDNLMRIIKGKLKGKTPRLKERETPQQAEVIDLMARLRASLEGTARKGKAARTARGEEAQDGCAETAGGVMTVSVAPLSSRQGLVRLVPPEPPAFARAVRSDRPGRVLHAADRAAQSHRVL